MTMSREDQDATAWKTIHAAKPIPIDAATRHRPKDYRELEKWLLDDKITFETAWSEFLHGFYAAKVSSFFVYPSPPSLTVEWQALLAGTCEFLCSEFKLAYPAWPEESKYFLNAPWDPETDLGLDMSEFLEYRMARSPEAFRRRNIAFLSRNLISL